MRSDLATIEGPRDELQRLEAGPRLPAACLVSHYFAPSVGGVETYTDQLARFLVRQGCRVSVVTSTAGGTSSGLPYEVHRQPNFLVLCRLFQRADIVHFNTINPFRLALAKLLRKRTLWAHFDYHTVCPTGIAWWHGHSCSFDWQLCRRHLVPQVGRLGAIRAVVALWARRLAARLVDENVVASSYGQERIALRGSRLIPLGVNVAAWRCAGGGDEHAPGRFLFWGRHIPEKGVDALLHALRLVRDAGREVTLLICGTGAATEEWRSLASRLRLDGVAAFAGHVPQGRLVEELAAATAVIVPSLHDEYVGLVALEAFSAGKVVIASDVGGLGEIVREAGLVFEAGNAADLAAKMRAVLENAGLREHLGQRARRAAEERYSTELMGMRYLALYRQLITQDGRNA